MAEQFAKPTFLTGISDSLATVDTYAKSVKTQVNNATSAFKNIQDNVQNALRGSKLVQDVTKFKNLADDLSKLKNMDPRAIVDRLAKVSPQLGKAMDTFNALKSIPGQLTAQVNAVKGMYGAVTAEVNGIKSIVSGVKFDSISSVAGAIKQLSGSKFPLVLSDLTTTIGVKSALIQEAVSLKLPGALTALTADVKDARELAGIVKGVSGSVVKNCDLYALSEIANSPSCSHLLVGQSPDILGDFAKGFTLPPATPRSSLREIGNTLTSTFDKLDAGWKTATRGLETVPNLTVISNGSMDFKAAVRASTTSTEADYFTGLGSPAQISAAVEPKTPGTSPSGNALLDSIPLGSVRRLPDGEEPEDNLFNKWQLLGIKDQYFVYMNMYGTKPEFVKMQMLIR